MSDTSELRRLAEAATQGDWSVQEETGMDEAWCNWHDVGPLSFMGGKLSNDTRFIAAANPSRILALLDEIDSLRAPVAVSEVEPLGYVVEERKPPRFIFQKTRPSISDEDMSEFEITIDPVFATPPDTTALSERVKVLEAALKPFADAAESYDPPEDDDHDMAWAHDFPIGSLRRARTALGGSNAKR